MSCLTEDESGVQGAAMASVQCHILPHTLSCAATSSPQGDGRSWGHKSVMMVSPDRGQVKWRSCTSDVIRFITSMTSALHVLCSNSFGHSNTVTHVGTLLSPCVRHSEARVRTMKYLTTTEEWDAAVSKADDTQLVVVDFTATWCGPCKLIGPKYEVRYYTTHPHARVLNVSWCMCTRWSTGPVDVAVMRHSVACRSIGRACSIQ